MASDPAAWRTAEYRASVGMERIRAAEAYAFRAGSAAGRPGGEGVKIALIDSGVDFGHRDLRGQGRNTRPIGADTPSPALLGHGTKVAGTLVARLDGRGMHGVAYGAELVSIERSDVPTTVEIAAGIASTAGVVRTYADHVTDPEARADILNMSFVFPNFEDDVYVLDAMRVAAAGGVVLVASLGNCAAHRGRAPECDNERGSDDGRGPSGPPASLVAEEGIRGRAVAVGSLDKAGAGRASHSNTCGEAKEYCLFAPGEGIWTTDVGGRYVFATGTSHAAPHVAGAAAVLEAAFPNKGADEIVARLLATARKVDPDGGGYGDDGVSDIYGHGALDLAAAINPVGIMSLSARSGMVPVSRTRFDLPPGFGVGGTPDLARVVAYDGQGFPFLTDLGGSFRVARTDGLAENALRGFLSSPDPRRFVAPLPGKRGLLMVSRDPPEVPWRGFVPDWSAGNGTADHALRLEPLQGLAVTVAQGAGPPGTSGAFVADRASKGPLGSRGGRCAVRRLRGAGGRNWCGLASGRRYRAGLRRLGGPGVFWDGTGIWGVAGGRAPHRRKPACRRPLRNAAGTGRCLRHPRDRRIRWLGVIGDRFRGSECRGAVLPGGGTVRKLQSRARPGWCGECALPGLRLERLGWGGAHPGCRVRQPLVPVGPPHLGRVRPLQGDGRGDASRSAGAGDFGRCGCVRAAQRVACAGGTGTAVPIRLSGRGRGGPGVDHRRIFALGAGP